MRIGVVKELTPGESRAALTPHAVYELAFAGHRVLVETGAGEGAAIPDEETPQLVNRETIGAMKEGSVIVDVDVDQGDSVETSRPTTFSEPVFIESGVVHYCVKNVPASVSVTATRALSNALLPYVRKVATRGLVDALNSDEGLSRGVAVVEGRTVSDDLARAYAMDYHPLQSVLPLHAEAW